MKVTMGNMPASVCDNCSNQHICKYSEETIDREKQLNEFAKGAWTQYLEVKLNCKYKQYVSNDLNIRYDIVKTVPNSSGDPRIYNGITTCNTVE